MIGLTFLLQDKPSGSASEIRLTPRLSLRGRTFVSVHCDGKRFVVRADEKLTAFVELGSAIRASSELT